MRVGQSAPGHHDGGWHLTGTLGTHRGRRGGGKLIGLDAQQMTHALGIAATQAAGMQQNRGTMCKSFHAGKAASNGVLAALLAAAGLRQSAGDRRRQARLRAHLQRCRRARLVLTELGTRWEIARNGYKPYACGVVLHPLLDAMVALRNRDRSIRE